MAVGVLVLVVVALALGWFLLSRRETPGVDGAELDYDQLVHLDAEDLAEGGIGRAYRELGSTLRARGIEPAPIDELVGEGGGSYQVRCRGTVYPVYQQANAEESWGLATYAFFHIINEQLPKVGPRFYAVNGGNDLGGLFLTDEEVTQARAALEPRDWPYLPTKQAPLFGQPD